MRVGLIRVCLGRLVGLLVVVGIMGGVLILVIWIFRGRLGMYRRVVRIAVGWFLSLRSLRSSLSQTSLST